MTLTDQNYKKAKEDLLWYDDDVDEKASNVPSPTPKGKINKSGIPSRKNTDTNETGEAKWKSLKDREDNSSDNTWDSSVEEIDDSDIDATDMLDRPLQYTNGQSVIGACEDDANDDEGGNGEHPIHVDIDKSDDSSSSEDE